MRLGDLDALKKRVRHSTASRSTKAAMEVFINTAPAVDPIRAAGGCYCRECRYSSYDAEYNKRWCNRDNGCREVKTDGSGYCDLSEPREAQDDG